MLVPGPRTLGSTDILGNTPDDWSTITSGLPLSLGSDVNLNQEHWHPDTISQYGWELAPRYWDYADEECWRLIRERVSDIKCGYIEDTCRLRSLNKLPVSREYQYSSDVVIPQDPSALARQRVKQYLRFVNELLDGEWIKWQQSDHAGSSFAPELYIRHDATEVQRASIAIIFGTLISSTQLALELDFERLIADFISRVLGQKSGAWTFSPEDWIRKSAPTYPPLVAIVRANGVSKNDYEIARAQMAQSLHRTLIVFLMHHYRRRGWDYSRGLTDGDAVVQLDESLFAFGVVFNGVTFDVFVNYPTLRKQPTGGYRWNFQNMSIRSYSLKMPPSATMRLCIFVSMLAIEQHMHDLKSILGYADGL